MLVKILKENNLVFHQLFVANPHVFISRFHPLAGNYTIRNEELESYPYLSFEQGNHNSFYFSMDKANLEEITKLVQKQKNLGFHVITDGEFRRTFWHLDFMWGLEGVEHENTGDGVMFNQELAVLEDDTYLTGKIHAKAHPFVEYYKFLKQFEDESTVAKYTIPAPAQTFIQMISPVNIKRTRKFYPDNESLIEDIAAAYRDVIRQFYDAGCRNLQLDDCSWGLVLGGSSSDTGMGVSATVLKNQLLTVNNKSKSLRRNPPSQASYI